MVLDNSEATFEFDSCTNYLVTPRLPVQDVTRQQYETLMNWTGHTNIMKLHRLRNRGGGGGGAELLNILSGGAGVSLSPQKSYILIKS